MSDRALVEALEEIREVWAGAECGEPVHAQEAYAIHLCKQMYAIAVQALGVASGPGSPLQPAVSAAIPNATNEHDAYAEMLRQAKAECDDDYTKRGIFASGWIGAERFYGLTALHPPPSQEQK